MLCACVGAVQVTHAPALPARLCGKMKPAETNILDLVIRHSLLKAADRTVAHGIGSSNVSKRLPDVKAAWEEATIHAGQMLKYMDGSLGSNTERSSPT